MDDGGAGNRSLDPVQRLIQLLGTTILCRNDPQWSMLYANKRTRELTGYDPEDFYRGEVDLARLIHPEDRDRVYQEVQIAIDHRTPFHLVYRLRSEEGTMELRSQDGTRVDITIPLSG